MLMKLNKFNVLKSTKKCIVISDYQINLTLLCTFLCRCSFRTS